MRKRCLYLSLILVQFLFLSCAATLEDYKPQSPDEEAIKSLLMNLRATWSNQDKQGYLALLHEDGKNMTGKERKVLSKNDYSKLLSKRMADLGPMRSGAPKIKINGNKAEVTYTLTIGNRSMPYTLHLIRESGKWLVFSNKY